MAFRPISCETLNTRLVTSASVSFALTALTSLLLNSVHAFAYSTTTFADNARAVAELGWQPKFGLEDMLVDSWNWQKQNPNGFMQD